MGVPHGTQVDGGEDESAAGAEISIRCAPARTCWGVPKGSVFWVSTPPPQGHLAAKTLLEHPRVHARRRTLTGLRMSNPAATKSGSSATTDPHLWMNVFHGVLVDPIVDAAMERLEQLAVGGGQMNGPFCVPNPYP